jgi:hypothetical protein
MLGPAAGAIPTQKMFTADVAPHTVGAGQTIQFTLALDNTNDSQQLGSANLTAPSAFTLLDGPAFPTSVSPSPGTATVAGGTVQLRTLSIPPTGSKTVTFWAEVPCAAGTYTWTILAKQSNNFAGPPGNNLILDGAHSNLQTTVQGQCSIQWTSQPRDTRVGDNITSTPYDGVVNHPLDGPFIAVELRSAPDVNGSTTLVRFSPATITLTTGPHGPSATVTGTNSARTSGGTATFSPGPIITTADLNYTLLASATGTTILPGESDPLNPFDVSSAVCAAPCRTDSAGSSGTSGRATTDSQTGYIALSVGVLDDVRCSDYTPPTTQQVVSVLPLGVTTTSTLRIDVTLDGSVVDRPWSQLLVCFASRRTFTARDGLPASGPTTITGETGTFFIDVLPDCSRPTPTQLPCQLPTTPPSNTGQVILHILAPGDDPHSR